jgi:O-antigen/teichoic acid export membrane protein
VRNQELDLLSNVEVEESEPFVEPSVTHGATRRGTITLAGTIIGGALMFLNEILAARFLGLATYGCYALAIVFARIGEEVAMFGFGIGLLHFIPVYLRRGDKAHLLGAILLSMAFPLVVGGALVLAVWLVPPAWAMRLLHEPNTVPYLRYFAFVIPLMGVAEILGRITRAYGHAIYHVAVREVIPRLCFFVFLLVLILAGAPGLWIAAAFVASYLIASLCGLLSVASLAGRDLWHVKPKIPLRQMYAYSISSYVTVLLFLVAGSIDYVMIGMMRASEDAGLYRAAWNYSSILIVINNAFAGSMVHLYPVLVQESRFEELNQAYQKATRLIYILATPAFVVIALNAADLLALMGDQFTAATATLLLLLVANLFRSYTGIAPLLLLVSGRQKVEMANGVISIAFNVVMNLLLIPTYGIWGAAITAAVTSFLLGVLRIWEVKRYFTLSTVTPELVKTVTVCFALGLLILLISKLTHIDEPSIKNLLIRLPLSVIVMAIATWRLGLSRDQKSSP